jgi:hypothetical protein
MPSLFHPGKYRTRAGALATIWERIEREGQVFFIGLIEGGGITEWTKGGKETYGHTEWDLIEPEPQNPES